LMPLAALIPLVNPPPLATLTSRVMSTAGILVDLCNMVVSSGMEEMNGGFHVEVDVGL
jgi:hypothetical protein